MKALLKKLRSKCGETLIESVAAILIFTFSSIILLSMVTAATNINQTAKRADSEIRNELYVAEAQTDVFKSGGLTVSVPGTTENQSITVDFFSQGEGKLYTFSKVS